MHSHQIKTFEAFPIFELLQFKINNFSLSLVLPAILSLLWEKTDFGKAGLLLLKSS